MSLLDNKSLNFKISSRMRSIELDILCLSLIIGFCGFNVRKKSLKKIRKMFVWYLLIMVIIIINIILFNTFQIIIL